MNALALVNAYTQAANDESLHMQVCYDQREVFGCGTCRELSSAKYAARKAMEADPAAKALYDSDEQRAQRRAWNRDVFRPLADSQPDDY